jgi:hypothetical protein
MTTDEMKGMLLAAGFSPDDDQELHRYYIGWFGVLP